MKLSIIAIISLVFVVCKSVQKKSSEEILTQIADTSDNAHYNSTTIEITGFKDNRSVDIFEITKEYEYTEQIIITKYTKHFKILSYDFKVHWNDYFNYSEKFRKVYWRNCKT